MNSIGRRPTESKELVRASDRISFLYLERCVVNRDSNAITATDERGTVHVPAASVGVLLLGPGTTITHQAILLMSDSGSTVVWIGERGVRYYAHGQSLARSSRLLEAQAAAVSNTRSRLQVARSMYQMRFPDEDVSHLTMQQLRGREGARIRRIYREHSRRTGVEWARRTYDVEDWEGGDAVNQALSAANAALYGIVHSVIVALGCSPALGFIHVGHYRSFVYDIADLYKAELSIPVAFDVAVEVDVDIGADTRRRMRDRLYDLKLLARCAADIQALLLGDSDADLGDYLDFDVLSLSDEHQAVPAGTSYGYGEDF
ncbi:type I-E CRISPR-associated endonuclease Cas1e [Mycobacterium celatum]|uniref:CRISPR-associated endonuclease Cas1 n=1 Tax=Mycobacterium celatum TaxID=28045 RepID=A0A1X1RUQ2_MYCCE|nr:type I-E CRISPR-associated endonuclease Cas1e [Mycobacterium celatum]ORV18171.1 type I-E CRISPR-associated endonuclease Cas1 [Mycobacterium celatum]PIB80644.1 type I-E CRISPR-associated endonuclease Cas1 [Mycobacterium celatum]